jgi:alkanesulfonate monooxygenase SsuD/methylene tetrahydromethanopterin reductase-like flavin-dependent oxidoreductase (luciferase family)
MKFGIVYNTGYCGTDPDQLIAAARHAEACGFESFYLTEHIALYPGGVRRPARAPLNHWAESLG